jgi:Uma2 family endonuclease
MQIRPAYQIDIEKPGVRVSHLTSGFFIAPGVLEFNVGAWNNCFCGRRNMSTLILPTAKTARFSLDHYEHMVEHGAFAPPYNIPVELIHGAIVEKGIGRPAKFSLEHYEHMIRVGSFDPPFNIQAELIEGEILMMSPIGEPHSLAVVALTEWSYEVFDQRRSMVRVQMPIRIPALQSEPEPDVVWVRRDGPSEKPPEANRVELLIEVAESSLVYDRTVKLPNYALAGIADCWIVNLVDEQIEVFRNPSGRTFQEQQVYRGDAEFHPLVLPTATLQPSRLFGG